MTLGFPLLSYQHSFHAANHADLLKHSCLCALLDKLLQKPKPFFCLDTHSGNGLYQLGTQKQDKNEVLKYFKSDSNEASFVTYMQLAEEFYQNNEYPGSAFLIPAFIDRHLEHQLAHSDDVRQSLISSCQIHLNELHPNIFESLKNSTARQNVHVHNRDGFELLHAVLPPKPNRGLVLIDPPYEQADEYDQVLKSIVLAQKKWPQGIYALWYPLLSSQRINRNTQQIEANPKHGLSEKLLKDISASIESGIVDIRWAKFEPSEEIGMYGSGMLIINPPYKIEERLNNLLRMFVKDGSEVCQKLSYVEVLKVSD